MSSHDDANTIQHQPSAVVVWVTLSTQGGRELPLALNHAASRKVILDAYREATVLEMKRFSQLLSTDAPKDVHAEVSVGLGRLSPEKQAEGKRMAHEQMYEFKDGQEGDIARAYLGGQDLPELAQKYGLEMGQVRLLLKDQGVKLRPRRISEADRAEMRRLYEVELRSASEIALALGYPTPSVYPQLRKLGVKMRSRWSRRKTPEREEEGGQ